MHLSCVNDRIENDWLKFRESEVINDDWHELPRDEIHEVPLAVRDEAVGLLAPGPARRLSPEEITRFAPNSRSSTGGTSVVLLRAVRTPLDGGHFGGLPRGGPVAVGN